MEIPSDGVPSTPILSNEAYFLSFFVIASKLLSFKSTDSKNTKPFSYFKIINIHFFHVSFKYLSNTPAPFFDKYFEYSLCAYPLISFEEKD